METGLQVVVIILVFNSNYKNFKGDKSMKNIVLIMFILTTFLFSSCTKLEFENPNSPTVETFWQTSDDAVKGVNAVYSTFHRGAISRWMPFYLIIRCDEGKSTSPWTELPNNTDQFLVTDYNFGPAYDTWNDNFVGIFRANQVLENVPAIDMDANLKKQVLGEAKFLRALFYYNLTSLWGNVPLILKPSNPADKPSTAMQTEIWAQIEIDLTEAAASLPETYGDAELGRATKGAANALLAKALMQQKKFEAAKAPLQWLCEGNGKNIYGLMPNYRDNFIVATENNQESVFEWQFAENPTENNDNDVNPNHNYGSSIAQFFGPNGIGWADGEANRWVVWEILKENTTTGDRDPRLEASFLYDSTNIGGPDFTMIYGQTFFSRYGSGGNSQKVWFRKFQNDSWKDGEGYRSPNNWRFIRYADVLLMYAECLNETGATASAYQYVDQVRQRAGLAKLADIKPGMSKENFLLQLKHERITELSGEGHRWNDLARWGDLSSNLKSRDAGYTNFVQGKHELMPIPQKEIDINPNLKQNPNW